MTIDYIEVQTNANEPSFVEIIQHVIYSNRSFEIKISIKTKK